MRWDDCAGCSSKEFNRRRSVRTPLRAAVKLTHPQIGAVEVHTRDISDGGAFVLAEEQALPALGEVVEVQLQGLSGEAVPVVRMRVVRVDKEGIGLQLLDGAAE
jgi:hypothetical protein